MMSKVALIPTNPQSVVDDYAKLMDLLNYQSFIKKELNTIIKINLSWSLFYPSCSTPPWQLDGVLQKLLVDGLLDETEELRMVKEFTNETEKKVL